MRQWFHATTELWTVIGVVLFITGLVKLVIWIASMA
jgi:hypothetical protein